VFDRDYGFEDEDNVIQFPNFQTKDYIVICTHRTSSGKKNKVYVGPFTKEEADYYADSSPYADCKHKVVQLFDPEAV
jgi:hypothetical protein